MHIEELCSTQQVPERDIRGDTVLRLSDQLLNLPKRHQSEALNRCILETVRTPWAETIEVNWDRGFFCEQILAKQKTIHKTNVIEYILAFGLDLADLKNWQALIFTFN